MTKEEHLKDPNSCWNKAKDDEPLFVMRAQDLVADDGVIGWMRAVSEAYTRQRKAIPESLARKMENAKQVAEDMKKWPNRKLPD